MYSVIGYMLSAKDEIQGYGLVRHGCVSVIFVTTEQAKYLVQRDMIDSSLWAWIIERDDFDLSRNCVVYQQNETGAYVLYTTYAYTMNKMSENERYLKLVEEVKTDLFESVDESVPREEVITTLTYSSNEKVRAAVAKYGFNLGAFLYDDSEEVKLWVVKHGYGLDTLIKDSSVKVRCGVACCAYGVSELMHDDSEEVRVTLARQGLCLDYLVHDESKAVRVAVAKMGYGFEYLIDDPEPIVRVEVAARGYGLDILINDPHGLVRSAAKQYRKQGKPEREHIPPKVNKDETGTIA